MTTAATYLDNMHEDDCPDCEAPPGQSCHWWCPRYADVLYDEEPPDEV
jgi:hypothetical protein